MGNRSRQRMTGLSPDARIERAHGRIKKKEEKREKMRQRQAERLITMFAGGRYK